MGAPSLACSATLDDVIQVAEASARLERLAHAPLARALSDAFAAAGFELAIVGGPVRDAFLDRPTHDLDFTTNALPDDTERIVRPIASQVWGVGREFGTIAARVQGETVEITTYRADVYDGETRKPEVEFGTRLDDDLTRRDFTVNALALVIAGPEHDASGAPRLVDVAGGVEDLIAGRLRTPQAAEDSFRDDPLRMLRAARFAAQLQFEVDDEVRAAMTARAATLQHISAERIRDELVKLLQAEQPRPGLELLTDTGLFDEFLPEVPALRLEADEHARHKDVYQHSLTVLDQAIALEGLRHPGEAPDVVLRLAALLHDIGKPRTKRVEAKGVVTFHGHDVVGARMAAKRLKALRFDNDTIKAVARLVELHLRFYGYIDQAWSDAAVRRYVRDAGPLLERLHMLIRSDVTTQNRRRAERLDFAYDDLERRIADLAQQEELDAMRPDLDGEAIMRILGIPPGRAVGEAYRMLLEARIEDGPLGPERAEYLLRAWWAERAPADS